MLDRADEYEHAPDAHADLHAVAARVLPPLEPLTDTSPVKTRANWRWMLATFLTGIAASALMGGALHTTFAGASSDVVVPKIDRGGQGGFTLASVGGPQRAAKGDRMSSGEAAGFSVKQIYHESTLTKVGAKEFIRVKPYARITASLSSLTSETPDDLPPFNPLKLFAEAADESAAPRQRAAYGSSGEIEVTLAAYTPGAGAFGDHGDPGIEVARLDVGESVEWGNISGDRNLAGPVHDPGGDSLLIDATGTLPAGDGEVTPVGEEVPQEKFFTEIEKNNSNISANIADKAITVSQGDTLSTLLLANGATPQEVRKIVRAMAPVFSASRLSESNEIRIGFAAGDEDGRLRASRVSVFEDDDHIVTVGLAEEEGETVYARLDDTLALLADDSTLQVNRPSGRAQLYESLYDTSIRSGLPRAVVDRMVRIHAYDVDFKRRVQAGDSFEVFYVADDNEGNVSEEPDVLFSALTIRGETKRFYRFRTPDDGVVDYYDEDGNSAKKFLIRKPMNGGILRSGFGMRRHPILRYRKMHTGVDWAARSGTPIVSAGNGVVEKAKWTSGYGRYTIIRHANGYKTAYAHQSAFANGIEPGVKVRQGQVIGYVGSTGLSTGPHLHYEVIVNGRYVDPMRIRVPRGRTLQGRLLASFKREKMRIERLMSQPPASTRVASRNSAQTVSLARK